MRLIAFFLLSVLLSLIPQFEVVDVALAEEATLVAANDEPIGASSPERSLRAGSPDGDSGCTPPLCAPAGEDAGGSSNSAITKQTTTSSKTNPSTKPSAPPKPTCLSRIVIPSVGIDNCLNPGTKALTVPASSTNRAAFYSEGNNTFLYGHNSQNIFGPLGGLKIGQKIQLTLDGATASYTVRQADYNFPYLCISGGNTLDYRRALGYDNRWLEQNCPGGAKSMARLIGSQGTKESITLMTCAGPNQIFRGSDIINGRPREEHTATGRHLFVAVKD